jgi:putative protease
MVPVAYLLCDSFYYLNHPIRGCMKNNIPELLAPAGSMESLKASVNAGADAVYLSGRRFGARQFAQNFSVKEMEYALEYAHIRGAKVYVTVNTLIKESELPAVSENLYQLYSQGVDAVIVQDLGVARLARKLVPDLDLHCSTQMTINNLQGAIWAVDNGFKRVILAREMSLSDIKEAAQELSGRIELEIFGHGAICYSYSGQCLLSSFIGGRSGNRGMCAQPCRKQYQLIQTKTDKYGKYQEGEEIPLKDHYLLSTRDLSIYPYLDQVARAQVNSIKIEGRMKPPEYVANVVKVYRGALDSIAAGKWKPDEKEISKLKMCFNRGLTKGWVMDASGESMMGRSNPGNRGLYLGKVIDFNKRSGETIIGLKSRVKPIKGDGLLFKQSRYQKVDKLWGTILESNPPVAGKDRLSLKLRKKVENGSKVFLTRRKSLVDAAQDMVNDPQLPDRIPLDIEVHWDEEMVPVIRVVASPIGRKTVKIDFKADFAMEKAIKRPLSTETIGKQLKKTGGTPFLVKNLSLDYPGGLFTPLGNLNHLRRQILEKIQDKLLEMYRPSGEEVQSVETRLNQLNVSFNSSLKAYPGSGEFDEESGRTDSNSEGKDSNIRGNGSSVEGNGSQPGKTIPSLDLAVYVDDLLSVEAALQSGCRRIYFQPQINTNCARKISDGLIGLEPGSDYFELMDSSLKEAALHCQEYDSALIWKLPDITSKRFLEGAISILNHDTGKNISGVMVGSLGAFWALKDISSPRDCYGSRALNIWNHMAALELIREDGGSNCLTSITLSPELSQKELKQVVSRIRIEHSSILVEFLVQGNLEALVSEDCLPCVLPDKSMVEKFRGSSQNVFGIKDGKNRIFPLKIDEECRTHIANSVELCLIDYLPALNRSGVNSLVIDARGKPVDYLTRMISLYQEAVDLTRANTSKLGARLNSLKNQAKKVSNGGITTGNFLQVRDEGNK